MCNLIISYTFATKKRNVLYFIYIIENKSNQKFGFGNSFDETI